LPTATRYYVKATATLQDGKESASSSAFAREQETKKGMDESQITGSTSSYARKYALNGLFAIDDVKDADAHDNSNEPVKPPVKEKFGINKPASIDQVNEIRALLTNSTIDDKARKRANDLLEKGLTDGDYAKMFAYLSKHQY